MTIIRHATHADIPEIVRMGRLFWSKTPYSAIPYCPDSIAETCMTMISQNLLLIAECDGEIAGSVGALACPLYANKSVLVASELFWWVEERFRNTGVGKLMLAEIENVVRNAGVTRFSMMAFDDIEVDKAAAIYKRMGYSPTERTFGKSL